MKLKVFFAALAFCVATSAFAADAPKFKDGVDAEAKAAVESAMAANKKAKEMDREWYWAKPVRGMWKKGKSNTTILKHAVTMVNEGKNEEAKKLAAFIEMAIKQGLQQAEIGKKAGPALYGF